MKKMNQFDYLLVNIAIVSQLRGERIIWLPLKGVPSRYCCMEVNELKLVNRGDLKTRIVGLNQGFTTNSVLSSPDPVFIAARR